MPRHNWTKTVETLKATPGEWILVAEHARAWTAVRRLHNLGAETKTERVTSELSNVYARWPLTSAEHFDRMNKEEDS